jgi:hypothetical protein
MTAILPWCTDTRDSVSGGKRNYDHVGFGEIACPTGDWFLSGERREIAHRRTEER